MCLVHSNLENCKEIVVEKYGTLLRHLAGRFELKETTEIQNSRSGYRQRKLESLRREAGVTFFRPPISEARDGNKIRVQHFNLKSTIEVINWFVCT